MNGLGGAPQPRSVVNGGAVLLLRVVFMAVPFLTLGFLSWVPMLRLAIMRRRTADWLLFWAVVVLSICVLLLAGLSKREGDWLINTGVTILLLMWVGVPVYFAVADARHRDAVLRGEVPGPRGTGADPAASVAVAVRPAPAGPPAAGAVQPVQHPAARDAPGPAPGPAAALPGPAAAPGPAPAHRPGPGRARRVERLPAQARGRPVSR